MFARYLFQIFSAVSLAAICLVNPLALGERYSISPVIQGSSPVFLGGLAESGAVGVWLSGGQNSDGSKSVGSALLVTEHGATSLLHHGKEARVLSISNEAVVGSIVSEQLSDEIAVVWDRSGQINLLPEIETGMIPDTAVALNDNGDVLVQISFDGFIDSWIWDGSTYTKVSNESRRAFQNQPHTITTLVGVVNAILHSRGHFYVKKGELQVDWVFSPNSYSFGSVAFNEKMGF